MPYYHYDSSNYDPNRPRVTEPLPPGDYLCRVHSAQFEDSHPSERIRVRFDVSGDDRALYHNISLRIATFEEKARSDQLYGELFRACGLSPNEGVDIQDDLDRLVGRTCGVHVKNRTWNGNVYANVQYFLTRDETRALAEASRDASAQSALPFDRAQAQPSSYRTQRTTGPKGAPGFDRYGESYPPQPLDVSDLEPSAAVPAEEEDIPF